MAHSVIGQSFLQAAQNHKVHLSRTSQLTVGLIHLQITSSEPINTSADPFVPTEIRAVVHTRFWDCQPGDLTCQQKRLNTSRNTPSAVCAGDSTGPTRLAISNFVCSHISECIMFLHQAQPAYEASCYPWEGQIRAGADLSESVGYPMVLSRVPLDFLARQAGTFGCLEMSRERDSGQVKRIPIFVTNVPCVGKGATV